MTATQWHACTEPLELLLWYESHMTQRQKRFLVLTMAEQSAAENWSYVAEHEAFFTAALQAAVQHANHPLPDDETDLWYKQIIDQQETLVAVQNFDAAGVARDLKYVFATENILYFWHRKCKLSSDRQEKYRLCALFREFVNPFANFALAWQTSNVQALVQTIYETQDYTLMPILADALQDAGCEDSEVLKHLLDGGSHRCGCWVIERLMGRLG